MRGISETSWDISRFLTKHNTLLHKQSMVELIALVHVIQMNEVIADCKEGYVPVQAISTETFSNDLLRLRSKLNENGMDLSAGPDVHTYYSTRIVKCQLAGNTLHVEVNLPILEMSDRKTRFIKVTPVQFSHNGEHCQLLGSDKLFGINEEGNQYFQLQGRDRDACEKTSFCHISRYLLSDVSEHCIRAITSNNGFSNISEHCSFICDINAPTYRIRDMGNSTYAISNLGLPLSVDCNGKSSSLETPAVGAVLIHVPCECQISSNGNVIIRRAPPCFSRESDAATLTLDTVLVPFIWFSH